MQQRMYTGAAAHPNSFQCPDMKKKANLSGESRYGSSEKTTQRQKHVTVGEELDALIKRVKFSYAFYFKMITNWY